MPRDANAMPQIPQEKEQTRAKRIKVTPHKEHVFAKTKMKRLEYALKY